MKKIIAIFILSFYLAIPVGVHAQFPDRKTSLAVTPAIVEVVLDPKNPSQRIINLTNLTNYALPIKTLKESFTPKEKIEIPKDKLEMFDASSWITLTDKDTDFILQPKEIRKIRVTIKQNKNASPGGHYASLIFQPLVPEQAISQDSVYVFARVAVLFFMQVKGNLVEDVSIKSVDIKKFYQTTPITMGVDLKNSGNTHLRPNGKISIFTDRSNKTFATIDIKPSLILPGTTKHFDVEWPGAKAWGSYKAKTVITYGAENKILESRVYSFSVFPYSAVLLNLFLCLILGRAIFLLRKRLKKAFLIIVHGEKRDEKK